MDLARRRFVSRMGLILGGASVCGAWPCPAAWAGASSPPAAQPAPPSPQPVAAPTPGGADDSLTADEIWAKLLEGNRRFVAGKPMARDLVQRRSELVASQHPQVAVLGCADSRVPPSLVFDQGLGDLFEVRTAGNVADAVALGSLEYAVEHVHVRVLLILGHEKCGGVAAAASGEKMPTRNLQALVDKIAPAIAKTQGDPKSPEFLRKAEEINVRQSAADLLANSPIIQQAAAANHIEIIKAVYSLETGKVRRLVG